jgi:cephalosporin-C deacetylase-like acetyl esterase
MKKNSLLMRFCVLALLGAVVFSLPISAAAAEEVKLEVVGTTIGDKLFFAPDEKMDFVIKLEGEMPENFNPDHWRWSIKRDGHEPIKGTTPFVSGEELKLSTSLDRPGFVWVRAVVCDKNSREMRPYKWPRLVFNGGAGVEIDKLNSVPEPEDFDEFWDAQRKRLADVKNPAVSRKEIDSLIRGSKCYAVEVETVEGVRPATGYLVMPENAKEKSLPIMIVFHGYNAKIHTPPKSVINKNCITFNMNAHGMKLGADKEYYDKLIPSLKDYAFSEEENSNPETAYFNGMTLRIMRALEYLKTLPEWDGKNLIATGGSQGGLQSLWAAGLDSDVTECICAIPWGCDHGGITLGRVIGNWKIKYQRPLDYYDAVNHAKRIKGSVRIDRAGLGDYVCPPSGIASLYNNISAPKRIKWVQGSPHDWEPTKPITQTFESK